MIVRPRPGLLAILFTLKGSILPRIAPKVLGIGAFACLIVAAERHWPEHFPVSGGIGPFTLIGLALSIFLSFRNSACYERWWEARKAWGTLIVEARAIARLLAALLPGPEHADLRANSLRRVSAFAHALHARLRGLDEVGAMRAWLPAAEVESLAGRASPTDAVLGGLSRDLAGALRSGAIGDVVFAIFEEKVASL